MPSFQDIIGAIKAAELARNAKELPKSFQETGKQLSKMAQPVTDPASKMYSQMTNMDYQKNRTKAMGQIDQQIWDKYQGKNAIQADQERTQLYQDAQLGKPFNSIEAAGETMFGATSAPSAIKFTPQVARQMFKLPKGANEKQINTAFKTLIKDPKNYPRTLTAGKSSKNAAKTINKMRQVLLDEFRKKTALKIPQTKLITAKAGMEQQARQQIKPEIFQSSAKIFKGLDDVSTRVMSQLKGKAYIAEHELRGMTNPSAGIKKPEVDLIRSAADDIMKETGTKQVPVQVLADKVKDKLLPIVNNTSNPSESYGGDITMKRHFGERDWNTGWNEYRLPEDESRGVQSYFETVHESPLMHNSSHFRNSNNYFSHSRTEIVKEGDKEIWADSELQSDYFQQNRNETEESLNRLDTIKNTIKKSEHELASRPGEREAEKKVLDALPNMSSEQLGAISDAYEKSSSINDQGILRMAISEQVGMIPSAEDGTGMVSDTFADKMGFDVNYMVRRLSPDAPLTKERLTLAVTELRQSMDRAEGSARKLVDDMKAELVGLEKFPTAKQDYRNLWWQRTIRENIKRAADAGMTYYRIPLGKTASRIEQHWGSTGDGGGGVAEDARAGESVELWGENYTLFEDASQDMGEGIEAVRNEDIASEFSYDQARDEDIDSEIDEIQYDGLEDFQAYVRDQWDELMARHSESPQRARLETYKGSVERPMESFEMMQIESMLKTGNYKASVATTFTAKNIGSPEDVRKILNDKPFKNNTYIVTLQPSIKDKAVTKFNKEQRELYEDDMGGYVDENSYVFEDMIREVAEGRIDDRYDSPESYAQYWTDSLGTEHRAAGDTIYALNKNAQIEYVPIGSDDPGDFNYDNLQGDQQEVHNFYQDQVRKYMEKRHGAKQVEDYMGFPWMEIPIEKKHRLPVEAFGAIGAVEAVRRSREE